MNNPFDYIRQEKEKEELKRIEREKIEWESFKIKYEEVIKSVEPFREFLQKALSNLRDSAYQNEGVHENLPSVESVKRNYKQPPNDILKFCKDNIEWIIGSYANHPENGDTICVTVTIEFDTNAKPKNFLCDRNGQKVRAELSEASLIDSLIRLHPHKK